MSALDLMIPIFLTIQFVTILFALGFAILFADPQEVIPVRKSSRRGAARTASGSRD